MSGIIQSSLMMGYFLACEASLKHKAVMRSNISSAVAGNEGLFNLGIQGSGVVCLESLVPKGENYRNYFRR